MSRKLLFVLVTSFFCTSANAEKIDCDSLAALGAGLDQVIIGLADGEEVDDELYAGLSEAMDALHKIADQENNSVIDQGLDDLEAAFEAQNRDEFIVALNDISTEFDALKTQDCN